MCCCFGKCSIAVAAGQWERSQPDLRLTLPDYPHTGMSHTPGDFKALLGLTSSILSLLTSASVDTCRLIHVFANSSGTHINSIDIIVRLLIN